MSAVKPILIFVPGAWHTPEAYRPTTSILERAGYTTVKVPLPSIDSESKGLGPQQNWNDDVAAIRSELVKHIEAGQNVVLIVHSYSGTVGSEACRGLGKEYREAQDLPGGVVKLVYIAAFVLDTGHSVWEGSNGNPTNDDKLSIEGDLCYAKPENAASWFYNECDADTQTALVPRLKSLAWKVFWSKVEHTAWREIPGVYLITEKDRAIPVALQEAMLDAAKGHRFDVERRHTDHSPFVSRPEVTAEVIRRAAGEAVINDAG